MKVIFADLAERPGKDYRKVDWRTEIVLGVLLQSRDEDSCKDERSCKDDTVFLFRLFLFSIIF